MEKWQIWKDISTIISCFLLWGWDRVVFNIQCGSLKVVLAVLKASAREYISNTWTDFYFFFTHDISGTHFLGAQTNIAVSKLLWLQPWGTVLHAKLHPVKFCGNADIRFLVCHVTTSLKGPISGRLPPTLICYFDTSGGYRYCKSVYSRFSFFLWPVGQRIMKLGGQGCPPYVTTIPSLVAQFYKRWGLQMADSFIYSWLCGNLLHHIFSYLCKIKKDTLKLQR